MVCPNVISKCFLLTSSIMLAGSLYAGEGTLDDPFQANECINVDQCPAGVYVFSPEQGEATIQNATDTIYLKISGGDPNRIAQYKPEAEWSEDRYALLFRSGDYSSVTVKLNYYTQVLGLGAQSNQVQLNNLFTDNLCLLEDDPQTCLTIGALNNFWRGVENVSFQPTECVISGSPTDGSPLGDGPCVIFNVSQAAPMRNVAINGDLALGLAGCFDTQGVCSPSAENGLRQCTGEINEGFSCGAGFASGGYLADSEINGSIISLAQQQWFTRDSRFQRWVGGVWNMFFLNTQGELPFRPNASLDPTSERFGGWTSFPITEVSVDENIISNNSKPYLIAASANTSDFNVVVPGQPDEIIPLSDFVVMNDDNQDIAAINQQLATRRGLLIEPGIFELDQPLVIDDNQVVLGIGLPELICANGISCLRVSGQNAKVAGLMVGAGFQRSQTLLQVDRALGNASNNDQASILYDIFCRIAERNLVRGGINQQGPTAGNCVQIDADFTVGDNLWLWRGDHDNASYAPNRPQRENLVEFTQNPSDNGLVVNGNDVTMFALFSEHHNNSNVLWNGDRGTTYFYQSEIAYKLPPDFQCAEVGVIGGCPSYYVAQDADEHEGFGLAIYTFFQQDTLINSAVQAPRNANFTNIVSRYLNSGEEIISNSGISSVLTDFQGGRLGGDVGPGTEADKTAALGELVEAR